MGESIETIKFQQTYPYDYDSSDDESDEEEYEEDDEDLTELNASSLLSSDLSFESCCPVSESETTKEIFNIDIFNVQRLSSEKDEENASADDSGYNGDSSDDEYSDSDDL